ncbi:type II toxin-antitoxin system RelE family toxin [Allonocardiopsis opalescens]|uniref:type II toxin-antitoxin system RelE family toxin n=1 Tax=Allonocardiopsis opalescens TaxID=1144618 RepID=UPI003CCB8CCB
MATWPPSWPNGSGRGELSRQVPAHRHRPGRSHARSTPSRESGVRRLRVHYDHAAGQSAPCGQAADALPPYAGTRSARRGAYRVLYEIDDEQMTVTAIEHRADVYRSR